jgi:hypothetical protein
MSDEDRSDYFERLDRIREIMAGDPDYDEEEARRIAREKTSPLAEHAEAKII